MLQIQNGKLQINGVAFSLPEGFFIESADANGCSLRGNNIFLQVGVEDSPLGVEETLLSDVGEEKDYRPASEVIDVTRADKRGKAVFSYSQEPDVYCYEERFALENGKQFFVLVEAYGENKPSPKQMQAFVK